MAEERRRSADPSIASLSTRVASLEEGLKANTEITKKIEQNTAPMLEAWQAIVGGLKVLGFLAKLAKWASWIAAGAAAVAAYLHFGNGIRPK